jgi:hypothetical protein
VSRSATPSSPLQRQGPTADEAKKKDAEFKKAVADTLKAAGYPAKADPAKMNKPMVVAILTLLVIYVTMVYGPIAAMLVEMFPTRIRYTSMSCRTTSATAGSAACCPPPRSPSWPRPATCTTACGTRS